ncbi:flagellar protein FlgN [Diaminobutyricimonas sp. TR449]|uniref:flagellar protein FlgN n=1 Tax=Diaminobutyricimonas sp. TR449 TaxID=2708076 RepID=UPI0014218283|nr:flagellar protein FlgN [Diaminobutyricimonas sp. TR449]
MSAQDLSALLWRERELLELLTFKLEEEQLLLTAGKTKWLPHATREVEQVMDRLREAGLGRSIAVSALAREWGTDENATLRELVAHAPLGSWSDIFTAHLQAMTDLANQIKQLRDTNEQFLRAAARSTQETLARLNVEAGTYDAHGTAGSDVGTAHLVDRSL